MVRTVFHKRRRPVEVAESAPVNDEDVLVRSRKDDSEPFTVTATPGEDEKGTGMDEVDKINRVLKISPIKVTGVRLQGESRVYHYAESKAKIARLKRESGKFPFDKK